MPQGWTGRARRARASAVPEEAAERPGRLWQPHGLVRLEPCWTLALGWTLGERTSWSQMHPHMSPQRPRTSTSSLELGSQAPLCPLLRWQRQGGTALCIQEEPVGLGPELSLQITS